MNQPPPLDRKDIENLLEGMIAQQEGKVLGLARRLRPGVTAEDIRNPQDFAALNDKDFHYEDGMLAGLLAALTAVRARYRHHEAHEEASGGQESA